MTRKLRITFAGAVWMRITDVCNGKAALLKAVGGHLLRVVIRSLLPIGSLCCIMNTMCVCGCKMIYTLAEAKIQLIVSYC